MTADGQTLGYDKLLLVTGAWPGRLDAAPGADLDGVLYLRTIPDSTRLRSAFQPGVRVVTVGAGWIGLETAAAARLAGCQVTVVDPQPGAVSRRARPRTRRHVRRPAPRPRRRIPVWRDGDGASNRRRRGWHGTFRTLAPTARVGSAVTSGGAELPANIVLAAIGVLPNTGLAVQAGLRFRTECWLMRRCARRTRIFSPPVTWRTGSTRCSAGGSGSSMGERPERRPGRRPVDARAARRVQPRPVLLHRPVRPQHECGGLPESGRYDQVVYRGDRDAREFIAFWLSGGRVIAGMNVNAGTSPTTSRPSSAPAGSWTLHASPTPESPSPRCNRPVPADSQARALLAGSRIGRLPG